MLVEAVVSGTPVPASRIEGSVGLLGPGYSGFFEPGDAAGLVALLRRARDDASMLPQRATQCAERATLLSLLAGPWPPHPIGEPR